MSEPTQYIKLSDLSSLVQVTIEQSLGSQQFWIIADVTNHSFKESTNYHYFEFVEKDVSTNTIVAKISGKAWGNGSSKIREFEKVTGQRFTNNINVLVRVKVNYHAVFGLSIDVQDIDPNFTLGVIEQQRQATIAALVTQNPDVIQKVGDRYITRNAGIQLGLVIQKIAVVSSKTSAGNEDFRHTLMNNPYGYHFEIDDYHTVVQNESNAEQFLQRLIDVFKSNKTYDAVIITRGGGAQTDFLIFDNYRIGLAIARFPIPVITGIGHQKNETIADLMAHTATKTPTKAAEFIITHNKKFEDSILNFQKATIIKSQQLLSGHRQRLTSLNTGIANNSRNFINDYKENLLYLNQEIINNARSFVFEHTNSIRNINQVTINKSKTILFEKKNDLRMVISSLVTKPRIITSNRLNDLTNILANIRSYNGNYLRNQRGYLGHYVSVIKMMEPENILKKGFAIVKHNGNVISNPGSLKVGADMEVVLADKSIKSTVKSIKEYNGSEFNL